MDSPSEPHLNLKVSEASVKNLSKTMEFAQKFWCEARVESQGRISSELLNSIDVEGTTSTDDELTEAMAQLARSIWRRLKPPHLAMLNRLEEAIISDGYIHFPCFRDLIQTILHEADVDLHRLKSTHLSPLRTVVVLLKHFLCLLKESRQTETAEIASTSNSVHPITVPSRVDQLISWAKENGLGDIEVPSKIFVSERSKLAIIEKQISGRLKLISMSKQKQERSGSGFGRRDSFYARDAEWKRKTKKFYELKKNTRCISSPKKEEPCLTPSTSHQIPSPSASPPPPPPPSPPSEEPLDLFPVKLKPDQKFFFGTTPPPPPGPSVTPEVYTRPLTNLQNLAPVDEYPSSIVSRGDRLETIFRNELFRSASKTEEAPSKFMSPTGHPPKIISVKKNENRNNNAKDELTMKEECQGFPVPAAGLTIPTVYQCLNAVIPRKKDRHGDSSSSKDRKEKENGMCEDCSPKSTSCSVESPPRDQRDRFEAAPLKPDSLASELVPTLKLWKIGGPQKNIPGSTDRQIGEIDLNSSEENTWTECDSRDNGGFKFSGTKILEKECLPPEQFSSVDDMTEFNQSGGGSVAASNDEEVSNRLLMECTFHTSEESSPDEQVSPDAESDTQATCSSSSQSKLFTVGLSLLVGFGSLGYFISRENDFASSSVFPNGIQFSVLIEKLWSAFKSRQGLK